MTNSPVSGKVEKHINHDLQLHEGFTRLRRVSVTSYQRTVPVPLQKRRTIPTYRTRTITEKAYRTSVPYFLAKIKAYRTVLPSL